jgi:hypothetical protein
MSAADYSDRQRELQERRTDKTGNWLLDSDKYNEWKSVPGSLLWLHGVCKQSCLIADAIPLLIRLIAGCGKSVLWYGWFLPGKENTDCW